MRGLMVLLLATVTIAIATPPTTAAAADGVSHADAIELLDQTRESIA